MTMVDFKILILLCHYIELFASPIPQHQEEYPDDYYFDINDCELPEELGGVGK